MSKQQHTATTWLWPDRPIRKSVSGAPREEHNATVNELERVRSINADLLAACERIRRAIHWSTTDDRLEESEMVALLDAAIARATA